VAHFHTIMVGGTVSAFVAGIHYWWPKVTGRRYHEFLAQFATLFSDFQRLLGSIVNCLDRAARSLALEDLY
jgi:heme/copper-type cytochrome/quinol oxidase subunit 1